MKRIIAVLLSLLLALGLFGCSKQEPTQQPTPQPTQQATQEPTQQPAQEPVPEPTSEPVDEDWDFTVIATEAIERPVLRLVNASGEIYSDSEPGRGVTAQQLAV